MAVKTITIDIEAYEALARQKRPGQSFSQVIKAHFGPPRNARAFREAVRGISGLADRTLDDIDAVVKSRRHSRARVPTL
jgi:predicted CopG family antitoxin